MDNLAALNLTPADIDFVMCAHLRHEHVGWNTRLANGRWVPTFPNARYLMSKKELGVFRAHVDPAATPSLNDSVLPVVEPGQAELIASDCALVLDRGQQPPHPSLSVPLWLKKPSLYSKCLDES